MIYENMSRKEMMKLLEQRNNLLREQHQIISDLKTKNKMYEKTNSFICEALSLRANNLNKRGGTIFWDVV